MKRGDWRTSNWCHTQTEHMVHSDASGQVQACITYTHSKAIMCFICSFESEASSMRSISFAVTPNSLSRCNGSPYVSQLLTLQSQDISASALYIKQILCWMRSRGDCHLCISFASPRWSSITSMLSSKSLSTLFQYVVIRSSSVHSRMTTHTGSFSNGRIASQKWKSASWDQKLLRGWGRRWSIFKVKSVDQVKSEQWGEDKGCKARYYQKKNTIVEEGEIAERYRETGQRR